MAAKDRKLTTPSSFWCGLALLLNASVGLAATVTFDAGPAGPLPFGSTYVEGGMVVTSSSHNSAIGDPLGWSPTGLALYFHGTDEYVQCSMVDGSHFALTSLDLMTNGYVDTRWIETSAGTRESLAGVHLQTFTFSGSGFQDIEWFRVGTPWYATELDNITYTPQPEGTPRVTNVVGVRRSGTALVDVTYDLHDADGDTMTVTLRMSEDGGVTFPIECRSVTGDVGAGVLSGTGLHIAWDAGADYPGHAAVAYMPRVCADDTPSPFGMVWIPPGNVRLGQIGIAEPVNECQVDGFWVDRYEVSNARYKAFIDAGGYTTESYWTPVGWAWRVANGITLPEGWNSNDSHGGGIAGNESFPVNGVSWFEADAYCRWAGGRLPTEAEWEKAAKGGCETHGDPARCDAADTPTYPWGEDISGLRSNYYQSGDPYEGSGFTTPVGYYDGSNHDGYQTIDSPSPYGLYDVAGNVMEWCSTKLTDYPYEPGDGREGHPASFDECCRAIRGGFAIFSPNGVNVRSAYRGADYPDSRGFGFRCVRSGS